MIKPIVKDIMFLSQKSEKATEADRQVVTDLMDTLRAHTNECVGMAANMIGVKKRIIVFSVDIIQVAMINPVIIRKSKPYTTKEGCLSLNGVRETMRYDEIEISFLDINIKPQQQKYSGWIAQIIQHEIDHCNGVLI